MKNLLDLKVELAKSFQLNKSQELLLEKVLVLFSIIYYRSLIKLDLNLPQQEIANLKKNSARSC